MHQGASAPPPRRQSLWSPVPYGAVAEATQGTVRAYPVVCLLPGTGRVVNSNFKVIHLADVHRLAGADDACFVFILQSISFCFDLDTMGMVQQAIEQGNRVGGGSCKCLIPLFKRQVAGQQHCAFLIPLGDTLKEDVGVIAPKRQIADFID